ncbi:MAG: site-specific DNA-methyltransferase [Nitrosospira sp.]|nr:site-specific DNA-methyltransferase [Nitrosospira sp.]
MPTLNWIGKEAVVNHHQQVPFHLLKDVPELACGEPGDGNLIVQGDNLVALKALLPYYVGQVKCIYIDPPYNTGNEGWAYNDNVNSPVIREWLGKAIGKEGETLDRHDRWLCMMYPRLALLKRFLRRDGSIWISMDDSEAALLRVVMDEIFGRERFIACNVWQKRYSRENREAIGDVHEYLLVYAMDPERFKATRNRIPLTEEQARIYKNLTNDPKGRWRGIPMTAQGWRPNQMYEIETPAGVVHRPPEGRCWSMIEPEFKKLCAEGRIYFGKDGKSQPSVIRYLDEVDGFVPWTWWPHEEVGHTDEARKEIQGLFKTQTAFDTPKPTRLLERVLQIATNPGDLILDSFAGSGTTGHAVLNLNQAVPEQAPRRFILVEMEPKIAREVTAERVRRVAEGYTHAKGGDMASVGGTFRFCELGEPLFDESGKIRETVRFADLARHVYFTETGEPLPRERVTKSPFIGACRGVGIYLLYNGILGDKSAQGGNVLTRAVLAKLPSFEGQKVIYCAGCLLGRGRLQAERIIVRQTPYEIKVS